VGVPLSGQYFFELGLYFPSEYVLSHSVTTNKSNKKLYFGQFRTHPIGGDDDDDVSLGHYQFKVKISQ
jgi:hypothetical protein